jgi:2-polyprenyl-6-methoxyphenol hydroxylase-like FAD-dependent oxidoreductase
MVDRQDGRPSTVDVTVVGAGPAGLLTSLLLARGDHDVAASGVRTTGRCGWRWFRSPPSRAELKAVLAG